jgi:hypothetical protein
MPSLTVISWRDIPSQIVVKRGRETAKLMHRRLGSLGGTHRR